MNLRDELDKEMVVRGFELFDKVKITGSTRYVQDGELMTGSFTNETFQIIDIRKTLIVLQSKKRQIALLGLEKLIKVKE